MAPAREVYAFDAAIVREPSPAVARGLRADDRGDPSYQGVKAEHAAYVAALRRAGVEVTVLEPLAAFADSMFVEDPALVFGEGAILLRPGAASRAGEVAALAPVLRGMFERVLELPQPGFVDGGDVLTTPQAVMVGLSARTDRAGAEGLARCLERLGRTTEIIATPQGVLHFKSACSLLDEETILLTEALAQAGMFAGMRQVVVPEGEAAAANALRVNDRVLVSAGYERTIAMLDRLGYQVVALETGEVEKIDAGLSCMSLRWLRNGNS